MKAYQLLAKSKHWAKGKYAYDALGQECASDSPEAVSWCALGAIRHVYGLRSNEEMRLEGVLHWRTAFWNDAPERTHAEVLAVLKELDL